MLNPFKILRTCRDEIRQLRGELKRTRDELDGLRALVGEAALRPSGERAPDSLCGAELKVFSQWGQDGIIQFLLSGLDDVPETFIEFGVQDYRESNTRFLLEHDNWEGLVLDGDLENIEAIRNRPGAWRYPLTARQAFVTRENINDLIQGHGFSETVGLLVIDIDGNDYHVWKAIEVVRPVLVAIEYNSRLGPKQKLTVPYDPEFSRDQAHWSGIYFGASLAALESLGKEKGYDLVGCNRHGNDAFFIRQDWRPDSIPVKTAEQAFVRGRSQEGKNPQGELVARTEEEESEILNSLKWETVA